MRRSDNRVGVDGTTLMKWLKVGLFAGLQFPEPITKDSWMDIIYFGMRFWSIYFNFESTNGIVLHEPKEGSERVDVYVVSGGSVPWVNASSTNFTHAICGEYKEVKVEVYETDDEQTALEIEWEED